MQTHSINKNNISMKALYFPEKPSNVYVANEGIRRAIRNNPFIQKLSEQTDVFVRYWNAKNVYYSMHIDIVDLSKKKTKVSMTYVTETFDGKPNFSEIDFINHIKEPNADKKGNLLNKILRCNRDHKEDNEYYHMGFVGPHLVHRMFSTDKKLLPSEKYLLKKSGVKIQREHWKLNEEIMSEITNGLKAV